MQICYGHLQEKDARKYQCVVPVKYVSAYQNRYESYNFLEINKKYYMCDVFKISVYCKSIFGLNNFCKCMFYECQIYFSMFEINTRMF